MTELTLAIFIITLSSFASTWLIFLIWRSDISHRARNLLSKWSNMFGKSLSKKSNGLKSSSDLQDEMLLKQRQATISSMCLGLYSFLRIFLLKLVCFSCSINEVMGDDSWDMKAENSVSFVVFYNIVRIVYGIKCLLYSWKFQEEALRFLSDRPDNLRYAKFARLIMYVIGKFSIFLWCILSQDIFSGNWTWLNLWKCLQHQGMTPIKEEVFCHPVSFYWLWITGALHLDFFGSKWELLVEKWVPKIKFFANSTFLCGCMLTNT